MLFGSNAGCALGALFGCAVMLAAGADGCGCRGASFGRCCFTDTSVGGADSFGFFRCLSWCL